MAKKLLTSGIVAIILFFCFGFCFASEENKDMSEDKRDLGSELSDSMNKVEKTVDDMKNGMENGINNVGDAITDNKMTTDYNATRTNLENEQNNMAGMSNTTWIWIIMAVVGLIILATVWFYAMQNTGND